ncbi:MAG TPA: hypothetical protein PLM14_03815 [Candidatus Hydrogenedentes bacterium]|nr:hypothetical protein [Candidatus Hydrogenedentota bacterium]HQH54456.1 hypothetical protein [Candidatus Hydrogenedentota bacterium]
MEAIATATAAPLMFGVGIMETLVVMMVIGLPVLVIVLLLLATRTNEEGKVFLNLRFGNNANAEHAAQDEHILHDMNEGLQRMEQRIEALETLLADGKPKGEQK